MRAKEKDEAIELRTKHQWGYGMISKKLGVPKSTLSSWLRNLPPLSPARILELRRESWGRGEASRELFRQTMRKRREAREIKLYSEIKKKFRNVSSQSYFVAGLMLYLAEGDKRDQYSIGLANTDPQIINFFIWWLQKFLGIPESKIKVQLHLYESMNLDSERDFWIKETGLSKTQFYRPNVRPIRPNSFSYSESFRHGTCKINVYSLQHKSRLSLSIKAFFDTYRGRKSA